MLSYWAFSDVFEEQGVVKEPFYGGFGLIAADGIPKPSFNAFKLLHTLGTTRIAVDSPSVLVTRREDGTVVMAVWNMFLPGETGPHKRVTIDLSGSAGNRRATSLASMQRMDRSWAPTRQWANRPFPRKPRFRRCEMRQVSRPPRRFASITAS